MLDGYRKGEANIKIIETFMQGKVSTNLCEDESFISEHFVAVIDGVTSKSDFLYQGKTTGKLAAEMIRAVLEHLPEDATVKQFIAAVNQEILSFYEKVDFPYSKKKQGLQAVCVVYSNYYREIWLIGDCQVCIDQTVYTNPKLSDDILAEMRSLVLNIVKSETPELFATPDIQKMARDLIEPWILRANVFANREGTSYGYSIINGEEIPESLIKVIQLDDNAHEIILTSDGYPKVKANLQESEAYLQKVLETDRECCNLYHSTKGVKDGCYSFDDRTYIRFLLDCRQK